MYFNVIAVIHKCTHAHSKVCKVEISFLALIWEIKIFVSGHATQNTIENNWLNTKFK